MTDAAAVAATYFDAWKARIAAEQFEDGFKKAAESE